MAKKRRRRRKKTQYPLLWIAVLSVSALLVILLIILFALSSSEPEVESEPPSTAVPLARNEYDESAFYWQDGFLRYANTDHMLGIDVSAHQGVIDWQRVCEQGIDYAVLRIGYRGTTVGDLYEDEQFRYNLEEAEKYGLKLGVYFFSQALSVQEAVEEAYYTLQLLDGHELDLPVYFDWEFMDGRIPEADDLEIADYAVAFCEEVERQGYEAGVYFNLDLAYHHLDLRALQDYHLWLAEYNEVPTFRYRFDSLQFTDSGSIDGIETPVDLDILFLNEKHGSSS